MKQRQLCGGDKTLCPLLGVKDYAVYEVYKGIKRVSGFYWTPMKAHLELLNQKIESGYKIEHTSDGRAFTNYIAAGKYKAELFKWLIEKGLDKEFDDYRNKKEIVL